MGMILTPRRAHGDHNGGVDAGAVDIYVDVDKDADVDVVPCHVR